MPGLKLWLFGPPRIELEDEPVELPRRKSLALLAYLALAGKLSRAIVWQHCFIRNTTREVHEARCVVTSQH